MRLIISKSKNSTLYYVGESRREGKKVHTIVIERIGSYTELLGKGILDPLKYAREYVDKVNGDIKESVLTVSERIDLKEELISSSLVSQVTYKNIGWLFFLKIYNQLGIKEFINCIDTRTRFDINNIIKSLSISRALHPCSKKATLEYLGNYLGSSPYNLIDSYRTLEILSKNNAVFQKTLFKHTSEIANLETDVFYYDCTNYYFETEKADDNIYDDDGDIIQWGLRQYGYSKEHRPNPLVQMGLFIDKNGIPISYSLLPGNINEQTTAIPLEKQMIKNYQHSNFIYCSDAGLGSYDIRFFNSLNNRHYVVTQSLKKIDVENDELLFKDQNWKYVDNDEKVSLIEFKALVMKAMKGESLTEIEKETLGRDMIYKAYPIEREVPAKFIKELGIKLSGKITMEEVIYVTFSAKYFIYQKGIFNRQFKAAIKMVERNENIARNGKSDPARFVNSQVINDEGKEIKPVNSLDEDLIIYEEKYHGFYALATNLDRSIKELLTINAQRWKIERAFRILKTDFDARPAYVWNEDHIRGHFAICYLALLMYQLLDRKLIAFNKEYSFSSGAILKTLNNLNVVEKNDTLYQSLYTGSTILNALNETFGIKLNKRHYRKSNLLSLFKE